MKKISSLFIVLCCLGLGITQAQVSITNSTPYTQNFDDLPNSGAATTTNPILLNWWRYAGSENGLKLNVGNGSGTDGGFYSAGAKDSTDRALGSLASNSAMPLYFGVKFINNTGSTIVSANVSYRCEQWRRGNNTAGVADTLLLEYSTNADSVYKGTWTNVSALTGVSTNTGTTTGALNGNTVFTSVSGSITGMNIPNGATFWIRFNDRNIGGSDDLLAVDDFSVSFTTGTVVACTEPANSVSNVVLSATGTTSVSGSFSATSPASDGYLVLLDESTASTPTITDATDYTVGQTVGTAVVVSKGSSTSFNKSGLTANTIYKAFVFPYNNTGCSGGPNYKISNPGTDTAKTLADGCPEPTAKPTNLSFTQVTETSIKGKFNKAASAPNGYIVVFSTSSNVGYPSDSITYTVGDSIRYSSYKSKVAYVGTDSNFIVNGLSKATKYYFAVLPYNTCSYGPNYNRTSPLRADTTTVGVPECTKPSGINSSTVVALDSTTTTITIKWRNPENADSIMIMAGTNSSIGFVTIHDSTYYAVGSTIPGSGAQVYYRGTDSTVTLTGLTKNTVYKILFATFNNKGCLNGPVYSGVGNKLVKTAEGNPGDCTSPSGISNTSIIKTDSTASTISIKWTNPSNADSVMVIAGPNSSIGFVAIHDSTYYAVGSTIPGSGAQVYYRGTDSSLTITGLNANTVYKILIAAFNNIGCNYGPNYSGVANTTVKTAVVNGVKYHNKDAEFMLYPNPTANGTLFVKFKTPLREDATVEIVDITGRKINAQKLPMGTDMQTIDVSNIAKGTYLLNVVYKGDNNVSTFIIE